MVRRFFHFSLHDSMQNDAVSRDSGQNILDVENSNLKIDQHPPCININSQIYFGSVGRAFLVFYLFSLKSRCKGDSDALRFTLAYLYCLSSFPLVPTSFSLKL